ncbi:MAG: ABC transporter permease [Solirubrobacterales bacterium]|nr:ABC transporter permease [Solirubrobacterales bacterium]
MIVGFAIAVPNFLSQASGYAVLQVAAPLGLAGLGIGVTMIAGEVDLSIGSMAALGGIVAIRLGSHGWVLAIFAPVLLGALLGAIQGMVISLIRISSLVLTIGTLILLSGLAYLLSGENAISLTSFGVGDFLDTRYLILSPFSLIFLATTLAIWLLLRYTRTGHELSAIGGGRQEAVAAGVGTLRPLMFAFAFSGAMGGLSGALVSMEAGGATPTGFASLLLNAVTAAVIGGVALSGGKGSPWGVALGALALGVISNGVNVLGAQNYVSQFLTGGLLFLVLMAEMVLRGGDTPASGLLAMIWRPPARQQALTSIDDGS